MTSESGQVGVLDDGNDPSVQSQDEWTSGLRLPGEKYSYQPLQSSNHFRLLKLHAGPTVRSDMLDEESMLHTDLKCSLQQVDINSDPLFAAISYTWEHSAPDAAILVDGKYLTVKLNLVQLLLGLRRTNTDRTLWIDSICINQQIESEKEIQIRMMTKIFESASYVIPFLWDSSRETRAALSHVVRMARDAGGENLLPSFLYDPYELHTDFKDREDLIAIAHSQSVITAGKIRQNIHIELSLHRRPETSTDMTNWLSRESFLSHLQSCFYALWLLYNHRYFTRRWILGETVSAQSLILFTGDEEVPLACLDRLIDEFLSNYDEFVGLLKTSHHSRWTSRNLRGSIRQRLGSETYASPALAGLYYRNKLKAGPYYRNRSEKSLDSNSSEESSRYTFLDNLRWAMYSECSVPHDKVFALVAMSNVASEPYCIDYSLTIAEVACYTLAYAIEHEKLPMENVLELAGLLAGQLGPDSRLTQRIRTNFGGCDLKQFVQIPFSKAIIIGRRLRTAETEELAHAGRRGALPSLSASAALMPRDGVVIKPEDSISGADIYGDPSMIEYGDGPMHPIPYNFPPPPGVVPDCVPQPPRNGTVPSPNDHSASFSATAGSVYSSSTSEAGLVEDAYAFCNESSFSASLEHSLALIEAPAYSLGADPSSSRDVLIGLTARQIEQEDEVWRISGSSLGVVIRQGDNGQKQILCFIRLLGDVDMQEMVPLRQESRSRSRYSPENRVRLELSIPTLIRLAHWTLSEKPSW